MSEYWVMYHYLEVSCKVDQIMSVEHEWYTYLQLTAKQWFIAQQFIDRADLFWF